MNASPDTPAPGSFAREYDLPRVPLPTLEESCARFLDWCAPLLTPEELAATQAETAAFQQPGGPGRALHAALARYDATEGVHSWLDTFWPRRYLGRRDRIALNANFFFLFQDASPAQSQTGRAAGLLAAALDYKQRLDRELLPPPTVRGRQQTMVQNRFLFSTTRIPGALQDTVRAPYSDAHPGPSAARHIVVFHRGGMYRMDVLGPDGVPHSLDDLEAALRAVLKAGAEAPSGPQYPVGHLTTMARAQWAAAREELLACDSADAANAAALEDVESALLCLCLEDATPADTKDACDRLLYGDGGNRWFDKALSLIVFPDGRAGINVEHCELDGTTILALTDALLETPAAELSRRSGARSQGLPALEPITFVLTDSLRAHVRTAAEEFAQYGADTATRALSFEDFGSGTAKALGVSPDAFVQAAYQLAHLRAKGHLGATYESIATRQYRHGRTEAMRVVTPEMCEFTAAMEDPDASADTRRAAFRAAAAAHVARAKECQAGRAPEQHLWELELIQGRRGTELGVSEQPALYRTPGWLTMRDDYLSTSSAPSVNIQYFGFGATSTCCIGVAYVLLPDRFNVYLSTPRTVAAEMDTFAARLGEALVELRTLLEGPQD
ncbi:choline/carnitine O-acyltransferase [Streptomyces polyrhachis]|uniref:Choline/carnitine O-acyltransferase n=1 Tax=Streptomyces polyrhachis TaxID=1282885 RepID=A0ABW2G9V0_9ACTN